MMDLHNKSVIIIAGPTAAGKTSAAIALAKHFDTEIISADSRQCFTEMNIGVARPSVQELQAVPHHFIASHSIQDEVTAATFETYALETAKQLFQKKNHIVMVGGTGLYIRAFCEGLDTIPATDPAIRLAIAKAYEENGIEWLQNQIKEKDPLFFSSGEIHNPQRMMRALEVVQGTGKSIRTFQRGEKAKRDFNIVQLALELPKETLNGYINKRVDVMMEAGLLEEVRALQPFQHLNALQTVGYAELFDHLSGKTPLEDAIELIKVHTRQYAKRQMTWFKKDKTFSWYHPHDTAGLQNAAESGISR